MRTRIKAIKSAQTEFLGKEVTIKGWVKTVRAQKTFTFVEINDGSQLGNMQVLLESTLPDYSTLLDQITTGASVSITGKVMESPQKKENIEILASKVEIIGLADAESYPLQKKKHTFEFLRSIAHLRPRTNTLGAVARLRSAVSFATHLFFRERGFFWVNTPIVTASDCEGAGELFRVSTLSPDNPPRDKAGKVDYTQDFFGKPAFLTVSGQLNAEIFALALSDVYTFGPTFRAENSNTSRHLAEFWMIEPEMAFATLKDDMELAESYIKFVVSYCLEHLADDIAFFDKYIAPGQLKKLEHIVSAPFEHATYSYAIRILEKSGKKFEYPVKWGLDLQSEHERFLTEEFFGKPVILTDYPKDIKAFYMRLNDDQKTVAAMDVLVPGVGEIIGGSQREERLDHLEARMKELNLDPEAYWWYLELRKFGSVPHAGFGVGFERLVQYISGMENIRDINPFPRFPGKADF